jgi:hypothetical protein
MVQVLVQRAIAMSTNESSGGPTGGLVDIARDLVKGIVNRPLYAGLSFVLVITAIVLISIAFRDDGSPLFALAGLAVFAIVAIVVMRGMMTRERPDYVDTMKLARELNDNQREAVRQILVEAAHMTSELIKVPEESVRVSLLGAADGRLRFIPGYTCGEFLPDEWTISMPQGFGSAGRAFAAGRVSVAILEDDWGVYTIGEEDEKLHKDLRWMISFPVVGGTEEFHPIWVLGVDGLAKQKTKEELVDAVPKLSQWSMAIAEVAGFTGTNLGPIKLERRPKASKKAMVGKYDFVDVDTDEIEVSDKAIEAIERGSGQHKIPTEMIAQINARLGSQTD